MEHQRHGSGRTHCVPRCLGRNHRKASLASVVKRARAGRDRAAPRPQSSHDVDRRRAEAMDGPAETAGKRSAARWMGTRKARLSPRSIDGGCVWWCPGRSAIRCVICALDEERPDPVWRASRRRRRSGRVRAFSPAPRSRSAFSCRIAASAAAPKITRVEECPVDPNAILSIVMPAPAGQRVVQLPSVFCIGQPFSAFSIQVSAKIF